MCALQCFTNLQCLNVTEFNVTIFPFVVIISRKGLAGLQCAVLFCMNYGSVVLGGGGGRLFTFTIPLCSCVSVSSCGPCEVMGPILIRGLRL